MTDEALIDATRGGDRAAFGLLVQRYQRMVEAAAYSATGRHDLVDDVVQDTFLTAWRRIDRLRDAGAWRSWLYGIARNLGRKARRGTRRTLATEVLESAATQLDGIVERERDHEVGEALARLPRRYREPLVLFYYEQCTVREVAEALAMRESAVMQRLSRGRRKLGERLAGSAEATLERKRSGVAVAALLLLLPARAASAAPESWLVRHWRPLGGVVAVMGAAVILVAAVSKSSQVHARQVARDHARAPVAAPPPTLPAPIHDLDASPVDPTDDPDHVYRVMSLSTDSPSETCARGARAVVLAAFGKDAFQVENGERYYRPSATLLHAADTAGDRAAETCGGDHWPESYVVCEGTVADIDNGTINCFPFDAFHDPA